MIERRRGRRKKQSQKSEVLKSQKSERKKEDVPACWSQKNSICSSKFEKAEKSGDDCRSGGRTGGEEKRRMVREEGREKCGVTYLDLDLQVPKTLAFQQHQFFPHQ